MSIFDIGILKMNILKMSILKMSISGAVMILISIIFRAFALHKLPKKTFPVLWGVVLARLLIPYSIPSPLSVYSLAGQLTGRLTGQPEMRPIVSAIYTGTTPVIEAADIQVLHERGSAAALLGTEISAVSVSSWSVVWFIGFMGLAGFFFVSYFRWRRVFLESLPVKNEMVQNWLDTHRLRRVISVRCSDRISAPLTFGILHPVILVPKNFPWLEDADVQSVKSEAENRKNFQDADFVLAHEFVHIRRWDAVTKLLLTAAFCVHWFNPAVWGMYFLANRDIELSCDEAVIDLFGENAKSAYAQSLIRMEEIRSGFSPLCNHFSKNAMEERIVAIMKTRKTTRAAAFIAVVSVIGITVAFSTSGQTVSASDTGAISGITQKGETTGILTYVDSDTGKAYLSFDDGVTYTKEKEIMSYIDSADGTSYYSFDGGKTWEPMTDEEFAAWSDCKIEWWTEEEYAAWLEEEKKNIWSLMGERAWTSGEGWFTWDKERIDRAIAVYEQTLQDIRNGWKISKSFSERVGLYGTSEAIALASDISFASETGTGTIDLSEFEPFGLTNKNGELFYHGKEVAFFTDRVNTDRGMTFIRYNYWGQTGAVYLHTVRQAAQNTDGSTDLFGRLVGIAEYGEDEIAEILSYEQGTLQQEAMTVTEEITYGDNTADNIADKILHFEETSAYAYESLAADEDFLADFDRYAPFGVIFEKKDNYGNIYYNGELVEVLLDSSPDGIYRSFRSVDKGGMKLQTVYDSNGNLRGLEPISAD